ncbi:MAG TPA: GDSL-type esterase/lipase family protein [Planctomycetota bacterium]|nr:GDSL-type esterase/lipase family protein [Planctomycetota bacterium]HRR80226.1 GDSL-type esterase/lipase family protein [Planctomycetota bacterium]HRT93126.1 GDSL-type esterase/lipase family protein [Planctomycetota bacterium]
MKCILLLAACAVVLGAGGCSRWQASAGGRGAIRLLGRWDASGAPTRLVTVNPGSSFEFRYEGTTCVLHFDRSGNKPPLPQLWVQFDGEWSKQVVDRDQVVLGEGAEAGRHQVWVIVKALDEHQARWKPPLVAALTLAGVEVPEGRLLPAPRRRKLLFEAIGDSITEGVLAVRAGKLEEWTEIADARATWAFQTALALGAEPRIIGFGAQGVTKGGNGGVPPAPLAYPFVYDGVPAHEVPADIVAINHGCNDGGVPNIENGYRNLIKLARQRNPEAAIFCLVPFAQVHERSIRFAVEGVHNEGDAKVYLVETKGWIDPKADTTDGVHPNAQGHEKAAKLLTEAIRRTLRR